MAAAASRCALLGALLAGAALAAGEAAGGGGPADRLADELISLRHHFRSSHRSASSEEDSQSDRVAAYQQCAGNGMDKKCQKGCLCMRKNEYFSSCKPIPGEMECNAQAAKGYLAAKKHRAMPLRREKERTEKARAERIAAFEKASASASQQQLQAAAALSRQQVLKEAATMEAVERDNAGKIAVELEHLKAAQAALEHTKRVAEKEAHVPVKKAEDAVAAAKRHLEDMREAAKQRVANTTAVEDSKVKAAKDKMASELAKALGPELDKRKKVAAAAKRKSEETADAKVKAIKDEADTKEARDKAAEDAAKAEKVLKPAEALVAKWKGALV